MAMRMRMPPGMPHAHCGRRGDASASANAAMPDVEARLAVVALVRNEARWLPEWIAYHALPVVGVDHFFLYDNGSHDELHQVTAPLVASGLTDGGPELHHAERSPPESADLGTGRRRSSRADGRGGHAEQGRA